MRATCRATRIAAAAALIAAGQALAGGASAQQTTSIAISVKDHQFQPREIHGPANKPITLRIRNLDAVPMEFESVTLRVEKVVAPKGEGVIGLRALAPGRYNFFDDFHQETQGTLIVE